MSAKPRSSEKTVPRAPVSAGVSYASAGVDIEAGDRAVDLFKPLAKRASRPEVRGGLGGFAGLFALRGGYREPLLASSTDGVGTKLAVAQAMDKHDTVGLDLVAMVVDDLVVCGAEPLFLQDYIAVGRTVPERVSAIVSGIAEGCVIAGCALLGGETAEHPGLMAPDEYDVAGAGTGVVEADLLQALDAGRLSHAVLDVFATEPLPPEHAFWRHPRVTVLPHVAALTDLRSAADVVADNLARLQDGRPLRHLVDRQRGY